MSEAAADASDVILMYLLTAAAAVSLAGLQELVQKLSNRWK